MRWVVSLVICEIKREKISRGWEVRALAGVGCKKGAPEK
jgi:hypothetical protein